MILFLWAASALSLLPAPAQGAELSPFLVEPYLQWATQTEVTVLWETREAMTTRVEFGPALPDADEPTLNRAVTLDGSRTMHEVRLAGLRPETVYFYRAVGESADGQRRPSRISTFQTAVPAGRPIGFAVFSDTQDNPTVWARLADLAWRERPHFALHAGDLVGTGSDKHDWTHDFLGPGQVFMSRYPVYSILGNHEGDAAYYYRYMANPQPEFHYAVDYGDARFFFIDTNRDVSRGSRQYDWLAWQLASSNARWNFVVQHHPVFSSDEDDYGDAYAGLHAGGDPDVQDLKALFETYGVDVVFQGHIHDYERTWPIHRDRVDHQRGVTYLQVGGAGGALENFAPTRSWFTARVFRGHFFGLATIADDRFEFRVIDDQGRFIDTFQIDKRDRPDRQAFLATLPPAPPRISPGPTAFNGTLELRIAAARPSYVIHYTTDGTTPSTTSPVFDPQGPPIRIDRDTTLMAVAFSPDDRRSEPSTAAYRTLDSIRAVERRDVSAGLRYRYYEGRWKMLPDFERIEPLRAGVAHSPRLEELEPRRDHWGVVFEGLLRIDQPGVYEIEVTSDDGSKLYLHDELLIDNDGSHSARQRAGSIALDAGYHPLRIEYFEDYMGEVLMIRWRPPGRSVAVPIPDTAFAH